MVSKDRFREPPEPSLYCDLRTKRLVIDSDRSSCVCDLDQASLPRLGRLTAVVQQTQPVGELAAPERLSETTGELGSP